MTTENGLPRTKAVRAAIETLGKRRDWLLQRVADRQAVNPGWDADGSFDAQEIRALDLAIPALEAEFDFVARLQREERLRHDRARAEDLREYQAQQAKLPRGVRRPKCSSPEAAVPMEGT